MKKEKHTFNNYQFKHAVVSVVNHPGMQTIRSRSLEYPSVYVVQMEK
jgi:hypothetical protein